MVDLIYNFIYNTLMGAPNFEGASTLAVLLTYSVIVMIFLSFIKLITWAFGVSFRWTRRRN